MVSANANRAIQSALDFLATRERSVVRLLQQYPRFKKDILYCNLMVMIGQ